MVDPIIEQEETQEDINQRLSRNLSALITVIRNNTQAVQNMTESMGVVTGKEVDPLTGELKPMSQSGKLIKPLPETIDTLGTEIESVGSEIDSLRLESEAGRSLISSIAKSMQRGGRQAVRAGKVVGATGAGAVESIASALEVPTAFDPKRDFQIFKENLKKSFSLAMGGPVGSYMISMIGGVVKDVAGKAKEALRRESHIPEFQQGGVVPGKKGQPRLILAHGGEYIVPTKDSKEKTDIPQSPEVGTLDRLDQLITLQQETVDILEGQIVNSEISNISKNIISVDKTIDKLPEKIGDNLARKIFIKGIWDKILKPFLVGTQEERKQILRLGAIGGGTIAGLGAGGLVQGLGAPKGLGLSIDAPIGIAAKGAQLMAPQALGGGGGIEMLGGAVASQPMLAGGLLGAAAGKFIYESIAGTYDIQQAQLDALQSIQGNTEATVAALGGMISRKKGFIARAIQRVKFRSPMLGILAQAALSPIGLIGGAANLLGFQTEKTKEMTKREELAKDKPALLSALGYDVPDEYPGFLKRLSRQLIGQEAVKPEEIETKTTKGFLENQLSTQFVEIITPIVSINTSGILTRDVSTQLKTEDTSIEIIPILEKIYGTQLKELRLTRKIQEDTEETKEIEESRWKYEKFKAIMGMVNPFKLLGGGGGLLGSLGGGLIGGLGGLLGGGLLGGGLGTLGAGGLVSTGLAGVGLAIATMYKDEIGKWFTGQSGKAGLTEKLSGIGIITAAGLGFILGGPAGAAAVVGAAVGAKKLQDKAAELIVGKPKVESFAPIVNPETGEKELAPELTDRQLALLYDQKVKVESEEVRPKQIGPMISAKIKKYTYTLPDGKIVTREELDKLVKEGKYVYIKDPNMPMGYTFLKVPQGADRDIIEKEKASRLKGEERQDILLTETGKGNVVKLPSGKEVPLDTYNEYYAPGLERQGLPPRENSNIQPRELETTDVISADEQMVELPSGKKIAKDVYEQYYSPELERQGLPPRDISISKEHLVDNNLVEQRAKELLKKHEGLRLEAYGDSLGNATIGYGHLIKKGENLDEITKAEADAMFERDYLEHKNKVVSNIPRFSEIDPIRQAALINMAYNMGADHSYVIKTGERILDGLYSEAAESIRSSLYASQVGGRAFQIADMIESGTKDSINKGPKGLEAFGLPVLDEGGIIPGTPGEHKLVIAKAGEMFIPPREEVRDPFGNAKFDFQLSNDILPEKSTPIQPFLPTSNDILPEKSTPIQPFLPTSNDILLEENTNNSIIETIKGFGEAIPTALKNTFLKPIAKVDSSIPGGSISSVIGKLPYVDKLISTYGAKPAHEYLKTEFPEEYTETNQITKDLATTVKPTKLLRSKILPAAAYFTKMMQGGESGQAMYNKLMEDLRRESPIGAPYLQNYLISNSPGMFKNIDPIGLLSNNIDETDYITPMISEALNANNGEIAKKTAQMIKQGSDSTNELLKKIGSTFNASVNNMSVSNANNVNAPSSTVTNNQGSSGGRMEVSLANMSSIARGDIDNF